MRRTWRWHPPRSLLPAIRRAATRAGIVAASAAVVLGSLHVKDSVEESERFRVDSWTRELAELPAWATPEIRDEIARIPLEDDRGPLDLFARGSLARLRAALRSSPWVHAVEDLELRYPTSSSPGMIRARLEIRCPVAIVHGTDDELVPYGNVAYMQAHLTRAKSVNVVTLEGAGHLLPWRRSAQVREALIRLIGQGAGGG